MPQKSATRVESKLTLPSDNEIQISRTFDAPQDLVWRAFTEAKLLPKWMGPAQYKMTQSKMDLRKGGTYRWVWDLGGQDLVIHGTFAAVVPKKRVETDEYMDPNPLPVHNIMTFNEKDGRTTVTILMQAPNKEVRDMMLASGMKDGMDAGYSRLDELLKGLK